MRAGNMRNTFLVALFIAGLLPSLVVADELFVGTGDFTPGVSDNDAFIIDVPGGAATSVAQINVWGAASNGSTVFLSSIDGASGSSVADNLWAYNVASGGLTELGTVTGVGGAAIRLDGLAYSGGTLYGWNELASQSDVAVGLYSIDLATLEATAAFIPSVGTNIGGIDADPSTGLIYGVDDGLRQIVQLDLATQSVVSIADYSGNETDIDGLAAGGGNLYLVADDPTPGFIEVFNLATGTFTGTIQSPLANADTFSGAAFITTAVPEPSSAICLMALCGVIASRRKRRA